MPFGARTVIPAGHHPAGVCPFPSQTLWDRSGPDSVIVMACWSHVSGDPANASACHVQDPADAGGPVPVCGRSVRRHLRSRLRSAVRANNPVVLQRALTKASALYFSA